jgi:pimeloyl-ACP methyl ester carboxylesterase
MTALRTPDERFAGLPDWPYPPHYIDDLPGYEGLRMHYVDEGPRQAPVTFVCLHGEPTWAYLYRRMIPVFVAGGYRVIAPDLFGFGRSDKPVEDAAYTFSFHRDALKRFVERCDLLDACLVVQDWGGILGLTLPMDYPERITRLLVMNTALGTGRPAGPGFEAWRAYCAANPDLDVAALMKRTTPVLSDAEAQAYAAPFPDARYKAGVRRFPELVPTRPDMPGVATGLDAAEFLTREWRGDSFMAIGLKDPVLGEPAMRALQRRIRNCPEPLLLAEAGHFVQEWGEPVARAALAHFGLGPAAP